MCRLSFLFFIYSFFFSIFLLIFFISTFASRRRCLNRNFKTSFQSSQWVKHLKENLKQIFSFSVCLFLKFFGRRICNRIWLNFYWCALFWWNTIVALGQIKSGCVYIFLFVDFAPWMERSTNERNDSGVSKWVLHSLWMWMRWIKRNLFQLCFESQQKLENWVSAVNIMFIICFH